MFHLFHHIFFPKTSDRPQILPALGPVSPAAERTDPGGGLLLRTVHRAVGVQGHGGVGIGHLQGWKNMGKMGGKWEGLEGWRLMFSRFSVIFSWHFEVIRDFTCAPKMMVHGMVKPWNGVMWAWDVILCACFHL